ncbi:exodeoxyribonuclease V subunit gamma [Massilia arenae]|uniref:RecBCD enzyme subunit RecC n=1 Tax=Massilia arenae TaxID=2603288 RepID=A0A5C7FR35_9BURK|nr:exodeoxyribonuclease V subunit gamma [Massilia arenae]TXF98414.1 exodeoxyribonuclease V subunit gamma [Massilia arenae]
MSSTITPGLIILHGNQMELLRSAVFDWLRNHPLGPLEDEIFLVQSNGVAEWLKIALAEELGVCAATRVALPARFMWEAYRGMLGRARVPTRAPFDKDPLTWRLMRLLPTLLQEDGYEPLARFLADGDAERRLQLAERVADLYDQYQVYRADWLADWAAGRDQLRRAAGEPLPLAPDQRWQACLWRAVHASLEESQRDSGRATIHQQFLAAIEAGETPASRLPRRVVLFGMSTLPYQTLQAIAALARHTQVLFAVPNPCRFYWGDIIEGRDLLRAARRRQPQRNGVDLGAYPIEELHAHSHPLLASWGRQGRDFVRMLDEFDNQDRTEGETAPLKVDLFADDDGATLLAQAQAAVRDLLPLSEHPKVSPMPDDRSIEFHVTHSVQREVEVLHDQLLSWFAQDPSLRPRDVVVMVPDIDAFSPAIHAVFGQYRHKEPRHIPFEIGDVRDRSVDPLLVSLEWLLRLPQQRCRQSEVRDLLDVPAVARRFGLADDDLPVLGRWIEGAGVRWGLDHEHRAGLGLGMAGEQNAWIFGVRRMLLGYASGAGASFADIEPYAEVGGLDAALAGSLAQLVDCLLTWRARLDTPRTPAAWGEAAREMLSCFYAGIGEDDRLTLANLDEGLQCWLETCDAAGFDEPVPLAVLREAWLNELDQPTLNHQFVSGGVTFCTLMPMRAVPFRVVCLLGMNDGDFPRRARQSDFDLLALPGMARPGDRSRRDDDRYLMLEALLAARDKFYVSWVGRNVRDNSEQPPSVLVSQLRDYLKAGWAMKNLGQLTTEHALQPFSRRYFEEGGLLTYAGEWRAAHGGDGAGVADPLPPYQLDTNTVLKLADLDGFLRQPATYFFKRRMGVVFDRDSQVGDDDEPFALDALERWQVNDRLLDDSCEPEALDEVRATLEVRAARLARAGMLPIGLVGRMLQDELVGGLAPVRSEWLRVGARFPDAAPKLAVSLDLDGLRLDDWIDRLHSGDGQTAWLLQTASQVLGKDGKPRADKLAPFWLRQLASAAVGSPVAGILVARDAKFEMAPLDPDDSLQALRDLARLWRANLDHPLPVACRTALAELAGGKPRQVYEGSDDVRGEVRDVCLARLWPDFDALRAAGGWPDVAHELYGPLARWFAEAVTVTPLQESAQ